MKRSQKPTARIATWLAAPLPPDVRKAIERLARAPDVQRIAVMPDVHLASGVCVGNVAATRRLIYPQAVGGDIGCGMLAIAFDADAAVLRDEATARMLLSELPGALPAMRHPSLADAPTLPVPLLDPASGQVALSDARLAKISEREGRIELGTLGRGNHFVEFQADEDERLWLMLHSGSRLMGQAITAWHMRGATRAPGGLANLDAESHAGRAYLADVAWARRYADANRRTMMARIVDLLSRRLGIRPLGESLQSCDHNHVQLEVHSGHDGQPADLWVHRKGAISARRDEPGIVPGSMGTRSYHVQGRGDAGALCSSAHGAGRVLSREEARRNIPLRGLLHELHGVWFDERLALQLREEAPSAYKDIDAVLRAQRDLTKVVRRLRPILVYKGV